MHEKALAVAFAFVVVGIAPRVLPATIASTPESSEHAPTAAAAAELPPLANEKGCAAGAFLDDGACVALPDDEAFGEDPVGAPEGDVIPVGHFEKSGKWLVYEQIPRRPDRPADYARYQYPIPPGLPDGKSVVSGYDLDLPDHMQRRGRTLRAVGHGAVDLPQKRGTPIPMMPLEHQVGPAEVIHVGPLMGYSVVTKNTLREGGRLVDYVVIYGHLDAAAPGLIRGAKLESGELVGFVGDTGSPELVHLHLEMRRLHDGVDGSKLSPGRILAKDVSIVCDPRNVLPLKP